VQRIDKFQTTSGSQLCGQVEDFSIVRLDGQKIVHSKKWGWTAKKLSDGNAVVAITGGVET
jgi:hypothetical protein